MPSSWTQSYSLRCIAFWLIVVVSHASPLETNSFHHNHRSNLKHKALAIQNETIEHVHTSPSNLLSWIALWQIMENQSRHLRDQDHKLPTRRGLGDFDELNAILKGATFAIPDFYIDDEVLFVDLKLWASNLECTNIQIDDIILEHEKEADSEFTFTTVMNGLSIDCEFEWR